MKMDEQPIDLLDIELAKQLNEKGFNKPSQCYWISHDCSKKWHISRKGSFKRYYHPEHIPAYSTFELFEIIPQWIDIKKNEPFNNFNFNLSIHRIVIDDILKRVYSINYHCDTYTINQNFSLKLFNHNIYDEKLVNALGKVFIEICKNEWFK